MHATATKLKRLGIDDLVRDLELSELGHHIAETLRNMTSRKRKNNPGKLFSVYGAIAMLILYSTDATEGSRKLPRLTASSSLSPSHTLDMQPSQSPTPPELQIASADRNNKRGLGMEDSVFRETCGTSYNSPFDINASSSTYSGLQSSPESHAAPEPFVGLCLGANCTEDFSQLEPLFTFVCGKETPFPSEQ
jgi:hypothetical protein